MFSYCVWCRLNYFQFAFFGKLKFKHIRMPYGDLQLLNDQTSTDKWSKMSYYHASKWVHFFWKICNHWYVNWFNNQFLAIFPTKKNRITRIDVYRISPEFDSIIWFDWQYASYIWSIFVYLMILIQLSTTNFLENSKVWRLFSKNSDENWGKKRNCEIHNCNVTNIKSHFSFICRMKSD